MMYPTTLPRSPFARFRLQLLLGLGLAVARGFCHHCQQAADWTDTGGAYRCRHCGADPLEGAPLATLAPVAGAEAPVVS